MFLRWSRKIVVVSKKLRYRANVFYKYYTPLQVHELCKTHMEFLSNISSFSSLLPIIQLNIQNRDYTVCFHNYVHTLLFYKHFNNNTNIILYTLLFSLALRCCCVQYVIDIIILCYLCVGKSRMSHVLYSNYYKGLLVFDIFIIYCILLYVKNYRGDYYCFTHRTAHYEGRNNTTHLFCILVYYFLIIYCFDARNKA